MSHTTRGVQGGGQARSPSTFQPRIRHITGIRIRQLTLPESLPLASKLVSSPLETAETRGYSLGESSVLSTSPELIGSFSLSHQRRDSASSHRTLTRSAQAQKRPSGAPQASDTLARKRSSSSSTFSQLNSPVATTSGRPRTARPRAPTLAGEALEYGHSSAGGHAPTSFDDYERRLEWTEVGRRQIARSFVVLKLPLAELSSKKSRANGNGNGNGNGSANGNVPGPKRADSDDKPKSRPNLDIRRTLTHKSSSTSMSPPPSPSHSRPPLSSSVSRSSLARITSPAERTSPPRSRTGSLSSTASRPVSSADSNALQRTSSAHLSKTQAHGQDLPRPSHSASRGSIRGSVLTTRPRFPAPEVPDPPLLPSIPFYISPIHPPSTHPSFCHLENGDLAAWLTVEEQAGHTMELEVWYEDNGSWKKLDHVCQTVNLNHLRKGEPKMTLTENMLELTLSFNPKEVYYIVPGAEETAAEAVVPPPKRTSVKGIVERSMRETRMKKGVGVAGLHQLVNMQAVVADTERGIQEVQKHIDQLLVGDADCRALKRDVRQREERVRWISEKIAEVDKTTNEARAHMTLRRAAIGDRRANLHAAETAEELLRGFALELLSRIASVEAETDSLQSLIYHYRSHHAQALDQLFPIDPLSPSTLLYTILSVPLPIPVGPKDPAPPLAMTIHISDSVHSHVNPDAKDPKSSSASASAEVPAKPVTLKIDERHTSAALGYVAMAVQCLANLHLHQGGGVPYPVTCAGSRSLVKDVVSVMQGPRGFPLYGKGVERYRYEYAVFLLNKDIESLMHMANVRLLDLRHTLPNLKALLLTVSSPVPPPRSAFPYTDSRTTSRQTSRAWTMPPLSPSPSLSLAPGSPGSSAGGLDSPASARSARLGGGPGPLGASALGISGGLISPVKGGVGRRGGRGGGGGGGGGGGSGGGRRSRLSTGYSTARRGVRGNGGNEDDEDQDQDEDEDEDDDDDDDGDDDEDEDEKVTTVSADG